jgi:Fic family protein
MKNNERIILNYIQQFPQCSSKEIHENIPIELGYATVKRVLAFLIEKELILSFGNARATKYSISPNHLVLSEIDLDHYFEKEIDERIIQSSFNFDLIQSTLPHIPLFTSTEIDQLNRLQFIYTENIKRLSENQLSKELERLAIDLSWKSSQIEGNTYSLLETEQLLKDKLTANGKTQAEAHMLLNHKEAIDFIISNPDYLHPVSVSRIEDIHSLLVKDLGVNRNIRNHRVGISGTNYQPLDNDHLIREAMQHLCDVVNAKESVFEKALLILILISYIQPFDDGNKRTARIVSNACLIHHGHCPISFRTVDSIHYKKAMLLFYEQNNISAFKSIFIDQFEFAVKTYF